MLYENGNEPLTAKCDISHNVLTSTSKVRFLNTINDLLLKFNYLGIAELINKTYPQVFFSSH
jgi:hypothetical protein